MDRGLVIQRSSVEDSSLRLGRDRHGIWQRLPEKPAHESTDGESARKPWRRSRMKWSGIGILAVLLLALCVEVVSLVIRTAWPGYPATYHSISVLSTVVLLAPGWYLIFRLRGNSSLKIMMLLASVLILFSRSLDVTSDLPYFDQIMVLGADALGHSTVQTLSLLVGLVLIFASLYFALDEAVKTHGELLAEHEDLMFEMAERERAQQALVEQENVYRAAIAQAGAIPYRINWKSKEYVFYDEDIYALTGYGPGELTFDKLQSMPVETRFLGPLAGLTQEEVGRLMDAGALRNRHSEYKILTKHGDEKWISDSSIEIAGEDGRIIESVGLLQDITERKREEVTLARNERYYRALIENALDLITLLDANGTILYESPSITRVLGYDSEELIGRSVFEFLHPDDRGEVVKTFMKGLEDPEAPQLAVFRCLHKDGSWRTFESIGRNLLNDPEIRAAVINSRDVTERVQLEQQLLQSQKMEGIGRLAGGVAHDFNNLLTCIMGYGDLALDRISEEDRLHGQIEQIMQAANRASDLTRQLLAFARKQIVEPRNTNLNTLTLNLDKMLRRLIGEDIELVTFLSEDPAVVRIDPGQFEQVVINLAVNARDAMPHGGKLTIEIAQVSLDREYAKFHSEVKPGDYVMLAMSDTGIGMAEEVRARIFEPFFTTKDAGKGTGLGLATCYGIVRQAGGHIWVYSEPGKGTTFKIYLPRAEGVATNNGSRYVALPAAGGSETILLVEDEPLVRSVTYQTLIDRGYTIIEAHDGPTAIELTQKHAGPIDLLLTDVVLPQMSGRELSERLRQTRPELRVLFMSGYTEDAIVHHGVLERGISFLPKPFTPEVLARKVRLVLDDRGDPATLQV
ncbi:MAG: hypothetical protein AMXMBFR4_03940 [Candidatus Hydrogenedentota bacterium]